MTISEIQITNNTTAADIAIYILFTIALILVIFLIGYAINHVFLHIGESTPTTTTTSDADIDNQNNIVPNPVNVDTVVIPNYLYWNPIDLKWQRDNHLTPPPFGMNQFWDPVSMHWKYEQGLPPPSTIPVWNNHENRWTFKRENQHDRPRNNDNDQPRNNNQDQPSNNQSQPHNVPNPIYR